MAARPPTDEGRHDWPKDGQPIAFRGRPDSYEIVSEHPERLRAWQEKMAELVGFEPEVASADWLATTSFCGQKPDGHPNPCDSDTTGPATMTP